MKFPYQEMSVTTENFPSIEPSATLSGLLRVVDDAIWVVDANLCLVAQNEVASEIMAWPSNEMVGRPIYDLISSRTDSPHVLCQLFIETMEQQQSISFDKGILLTTKEGTPVLVGGKITPIFCDDQLVGAICVFGKIPSVKGKSYLQYEFADMASHLLRTPLSLIQTSIDLLMNSELDVVEQQAMLSQMRKQSRRLTIFTNELLEMLQLETEGMGICVEPIALVSLIEQVLNTMRSEKPHHIFTLIAADTLPTVAADPTKTELILSNLIISALRRCPTEGNITIELEAETSEVIISVIDNGIPIPTKLLDKIFLQFYSEGGENGNTPSNYQLGLYTAKQLVELQNGRIWAKSQPGQYSRFSFSLPIWEKR